MKVVERFWAVAPTPLLKEEGWTRHQERCREATFAGADGVVTHDETFQNADHPVCGAKVGFAAFLTPQPPLLYQEGSCPPLFRVCPGFIEMLREPY